MRKGISIKRKLLRSFSLIGTITILMCLLNFSALTFIQDYNKEVESVFEEYCETNDASLEQEIEFLLSKSDTRVNGTLVFNIGLVIFSISSVLIVTVRMDRKIGKPLKDVNEKIASVSLGDLTADFGSADISIPSKDEVIAIKQHMAHTERNLSDIISGARDISKDVTDSMNNLNNGADMISKAANDMACAASEVANGAVSTAEDTSKAMGVVTDIENNIINIKNNTEDLSKASNNMNDAKNNVLTLLDNFVEVNKIMNQNVEETNTQINITSENVKEIQKFIEVIKDIASQTNLLSLNASIEAAHSGEAGKGFAVVAGEIRRLSEQSAQSSNEIENTLNGLISNYELIVEKMRNTNENINSQKEKLDETRSNFIILEKDIKLTVDKIADIESKVQQLDEMRQILIDIISNLSAVSEENAASSEQTTASIEELSSTITQMCENIKDVKNKAKNLYASIEVFKIEP